MQAPDAADSAEPQPSPAGDSGEDGEDAGDESDEESEGEEDDDGDENDDPDAETAAPARRGKRGRPTGAKRMAGATLCPRPLAAINPADDLVVGVTTAPSAETACMLCCEVNEKWGRSASTAHHKSKRAVISRCKCKGACDYFVRFQCKPSETDFRLTVFRQHTCMGVGGQAARRARSNYSPEALGAAIAPTFAALKGKMTHAAVRAALAQITPVTLSSTHVGRVTAAAAAALYGSREEQAALVEPLAEELRAHGHHVEVLTVGKDKMAELMVERARYDYVQVHGNEKDAPAFDPATVDVSSMENYPDDAMFVYAVLVRWAHVDKILPYLLPVTSMDGAHVKGMGDMSNYRGTLFGIYGYDANKNTHPLAQAWFLDNERTETWAKFLKLVPAALNSPERINIIDGEKGSARAWREGLPLSHLFMCQRHKAERLKKNGGTAEDVRLYTKEAVNAPTPAELEKAKGQLSAKGREYLDKTPDKELYMVHTEGRTCGYSTSQAAESNNSASVEERKSYGPAGFMRAVFDGTFRRYQDNKAMAEKWNEPLPPSSKKKLGELVKEIEEKSYHVRKVGNMYEVRISSEDGEVRATHMVDLASVSCTCKRAVVHHRPCKCLIVAARAAGIAPETLFPADVTTAQWKAMYEAAGDLEYVTETAVAARPRGKHFLPLVGKPPKGRPKAHGRKKGAMERAQIRAREAQHNTNMTARRLAAGAGASSQAQAGAGATGAAAADAPMPQA